MRLGEIAAWRGQNLELVGLLVSQAYQSARLIRLLNRIWIAYESLQLKTVSVLLHDM